MYASAWNSFLTVSEEFVPWLKSKGEPKPAPLDAERCLRSAAAQSDNDVREDVVDLLAHRKKDNDDDDRDQYQDQRVLDHTLTALAVRACRRVHLALAHLLSIGCPL